MDGVSSADVTKCQQQYHKIALLSPDGAEGGLSSGNAELPINKAQSLNIFKTLIVSSRESLQFCNAIMDGFELA